MNDIESLLWDIQYEAERREEEYRDAYEKAKEAMKFAFGVLTLDELEAIVASMPLKDSVPLIKDRALRKKYEQCLSHFFGYAQHLFGDEGEPLGNDPYFWPVKQLKPYLEYRKNLENKQNNKKNKKR